MKAIILIIAVFSVMLPVITQKTGLSERHGFPLKMLCAFMYMLTGVLSAVYTGEKTEYSLMILGGLLLGVLGDFFLEYKKKRYFSIGVVFFALGHIVYSLTFLFAGAYKAVGHITAVISITAVLTAAIIIFARARMKLGGKKNILLLYAAVLIFTFAAAMVSGMVAAAEGNPFFALCLMTASSLFVFSDMLIGAKIGGMRRPKIFHYCVSYTYFAAQTLFALSIIFQ